VRIKPTGDIGQGIQILIGCMNLGFKPTHLTGRGRPSNLCALTDDSTDQRINPETFCIIGILIAGQSTIPGLSQQGRYQMLNVLACLGVLKQIVEASSQTKNLIQFPIHQQSGIATDRRPMKYQLHLPIKLDP
jgi:hypothetical protein